LSGLLAEIDQDSAGLEHTDWGAIRTVWINDGGDLVVGTDLQECGVVLLALGDVDDLDGVGQSHLFQGDADLAAIGGVVGEKLDRHDGLRAKKNQRSVAPMTAVWK
jgi:hypothetical protein